MAKPRDLKQDADRKLKVTKPVVKRKSNSMGYFGNTTIFVCLFFLVVLTYLVFSNSLKNYFIINFDDNLYVMGVQDLKNLSYADVKTIFTTIIKEYYHPLAILSLAVDYHFYGLDAYHFHLTNLIFHIANVILVFRLIYILCKRIEAAFIVSLFFAVHPMHVESVSWISERKDVLYTFFFLFSLISYLIYLKNDKKYGYLVLSLIFFIFSLLSKPAATCLTVAIVLFDYYWMRKFTLRVILEKVPFLLLSITFGIIAISAQKSVGALNDLSMVYSYFDRIFLISFSFMFYIVKAVFPFNLSAIYYYPDKINGWLPMNYYIAPLGIAFIIFMIIKFTKIRRELLFGFVFYFVTIALVLQFIPVGFAIVSERYSYVPYIGLFFIVGKLYCDFVDNKFGNFNKTRRNYINFLILLLAALFSFGSHERNKVWSSGIALFSDIIEKNPDRGHAYFARGNAKYENKDKPGALADFQDAIKHNYKSPMVYNNRADCYGHMDSTAKAIIGFTEAINLDSTFGSAYFNRALAKQKIKDYAGSVDDYKKAIKYDFNAIEAYNQIGYSLLRLKKLKESLPYFDKAIHLKPGFAAAYHNRAMVEHSLKNYDAALEDYNEAIKLDPKSGMIYYNRGFLRMAMNDFGSACDDLNKALQLGYKMAEVAIGKNCK
jgi:protein O-mannosyl-transferase